MLCRRPPPRLPEVGLAKGDRQWADRLRVVSTQVFADRRQGEAALRLLPKDAKAGECAEQTVQGVGVTAGRSSQLVAAAWAVTQVVSDAERRGDMDRLRHVEACEQAHQADL